MVEVGEIIASETLRAMKVGLRELLIERKNKPNILLLISIAGERRVRIEKQNARKKDGHKLVNEKIYLRLDRKV